MSIVSDKEIQKRIDFNPHKGQQKVLNEIYAGKRDVVIAAGRRWGKSKLCAYLVLRALIATDKRIWIVAPTYDLTQKVFDYVVQYIGKGFPSLKSGISSRPTPRIETPHGSWVQCKSTENPDGLLGEELDLAIVDEVSRIKKDVFDMYLYPCLSSRRGKSVMISTPFGQNWFYHQWLRAKDSEDGAAFRFPSNSNPYLPKGEWERAKERLPEKIFLQEYTASFEPESAGVFTNVRECIKGELEDEQAGRKYVMGVDLGRAHDFTAICVIDKLKRHVVYFERFKKLGWSLQKKRIIAVSKRYNNARIWIDASGKGDPVVDQLEDEGILVEPFKIGSNRPKRQLVEKASMLLSQKSITYPDIPYFIDEMEAFTYNLTPSGIIQYQAPLGLHDDSVMAFCLALQGITGREKDLTPIQQELQKHQRLNPRPKKQYI